MGFLGGIGKVFSGIGNAIKSFATSGIGSMLLKAGATALLGPLGGVAASAITNFAKGGFNLKSLLKTGLDTFAPLASKFGLGDIVNNLPSILKNPTSLLSNGGLGNIVKGLLGNTGLGQKITGILGKASGFLGNVTGFGAKASDILGKATGLLNSFGIKPPAFLGDFSGKLNSVLGALGKVQDVLKQVGGVLDGGSVNTALRA